MSGETPSTAKFIGRTILATLLASIYAFIVITWALKIWPALSSFVVGRIALPAAVSALGTESFSFFPNQLLFYLLGIPALPLYAVFSLFLSKRRFKVLSLPIAGLVAGELYAFLICIFIGSLQNDETTAMMMPGFFQMAFVAFLGVGGILVGLFHFALITTWKDRWRVATAGFAASYALLFFLITISAHASKVNYFSQPDEVLQNEATHGDTKAQIVLGLRAEDWRHYDRSKAMYWYKTAADSGNADAQGRLGKLYESELPSGGGAHDYKQAAQWYQKAAEQGSTQGQMDLSNLYERGLGVSQDHSKAYYWLYIASQNNSGTNNDVFLNKIASEVDAGQIEKLQAQAKIWISDHHTKNWCKAASESNPRLNCADSSYR